LESLVPPGAQVLGPVIQPAYAAQLLLATGAFTSSPPEFAFGDGAGNYVFTNSSTTVVESVLWGGGTQTLVPEPASLGIIGVCSVFLLARRRRKDKTTETIHGATSRANKRDNK
jgi:hypothetical protein